MRILSFSTLFFLIIVVGCSSKTVEPQSNETSLENGKSIFLSGYNLEGVALQNLQLSEKSGMVHGCAQCHGQDGKGKFRGGGANQTGSIRYEDLTNPNLHAIPYTDALIRRFIDSETKSDGTHAQTGVVYVMSESDKSDLISYLKVL